MNNKTIPDTEARVMENTSEVLNERIQRQIEETLLYYSERVGQIEQRLAELDEEWDIERALEANAGIITLFGVSMSFFNSRKWLALPFIVSGFLVQHAIQGWCPPVPLMRRMGFRTTREINKERYALKALRGDFTHMSDTTPVSNEIKVERALAGAEP